MEYTIDPSDLEGLAYAVGRRLSDAEISELFALIRCVGYGKSLATRPQVIDDERPVRN